MNKIFLNIADFNLAVNFKMNKLMVGIFEAERNKLIQDITLYCRNFILKSRPKRIDFTIDISFIHPDILRKKKDFYIMLYRSLGKNRIETSYLINIFEFQWILQGALHLLFLKSGALVFHASANSFGDEAHLFVGKSGAGKSTIMKLLDKKYRALGDDSIIVRRQNGKINCYQTPLVEKNSWMNKTSKKYRLGKIFFLKKAKFFKIEKITDKEYVLNKALDHAWMIKIFNKSSLKSMLEFVDNFDEFYFLYFSKYREELLDFFSKHLSSHQQKSS